MAICPTPQTAEERTSMGLDLWFRQDVARILASTWETMRACVNAAAAVERAQPGAEGMRMGAVATSDERLAAAYRRGFEDALRAVGVAFGLAESNNGGRRAAYPPEYPGAPVDYARSWEDD